MAIEHEDLPVTVESIHKLQAEIIRIRREFVISRLKLEEITTQFIGSLSRERDLNQQVSELSAQVNTLREELLQLQGSPDTSTSQVLDTLKKEFATLQTAYEACQKKNKDLETSLNHFLPSTPPKTVVDKAMGTYGKPLNRAASIALKKLLS